MSFLSFADMARQMPEYGAPKRYSRTDGGKEAWASVLKPRLADSVDVNMTHRPVGGIGPLLWFSREESHANPPSVMYVKIRLRDVSHTRRGM